mgnify:CR=1 FL=1
MGEKRLSREAIARIEIGHTEVSPRLRVLLTLFFLAWIVAVPLGQFAVDVMGGRTLPGFDISHKKSSVEQNIVARIEEGNNRLLHNMKILETDLEENSFLRGICLPTLQYFLTRFLGQGNEKVVVGKGGILHYSPGIDALIGPPFLSETQQRLRIQAANGWEKPVQPDPLLAIRDFRDQLAQRDIALLLMIVPTKVSVEPATLSSRVFQAAPVNRSWPDFTSLLEKEKIPLFDPRRLLESYAREHQSAYLATDTHWLPGAMEMVAQELAGYIRQQFPQLSLDSLEFQSVEQPQEGEGDIARMLVLPAGEKLYPSQRVITHQVLSPENEFWQPNRESQLLLLGDSFTNIYSVEGLGWGRGSGFAEQLSRLLGTPLDLLARNDNGAYVTREMLSSELHRGRDRLEGKRLVIWQFAERELALGDWRLFDLKLREAVESDFYQVEAGQKEVVVATVAAISRSARPGSVPYRDNILTLQLVDVDGENGTSHGQAIVYGWGMQDNVLTALARVRPGDRVKMTLTSWDAVESQFGGYRRSPLDDEMLELESPNWGELDDDTNQ